MSNAFEVYQMYSALKMHFTTNYNYFKYNGKTNLKKESFEKSKLKYYCLRLSRKYNNILDVQDFLLSNFIEDEKTWIGELLSEKGEENYIKWKKYHQSFTYNFKEQVAYLLDNYRLNELFKSIDDFPPIIKEYQQGNITLETLCLFCYFFDLITKWDQEIKDDLLYPSIKTRILKYSPFLFNRLDMEKIKKTLKEVLESKV